MKPRSFLFPRRVVQVGCALAFIVIPFLNRAEFNALNGNFLAFNFAGVPLADPLAAVQVMASALSVPSSMLIGALLALLLAFFLGPVFCSWLCPYGLLSELVHGKKTEHPRQGGGAAKEERPAVQSRQPGPDELPFISRLLVWIAGMALVAMMVPFPLLNQISMPGWYSRAMQHIALYEEAIWGGLALLLFMLLLEAARGKRIWCRYLCPQSVLISLSGVLFPKRLQVAFTRKKCTCPASDRACGKACSLQLDPRADKSLAQRLQCTNCGDCIDACREKGKALDMRFGAGK